MATVQSTVDTGHEDMVHDAQMDYYGTRLATCSSDKLVKIFEVKDGTQVTIFVRSASAPVACKSLEIDLRDFLTLFQAICIGLKA